MFLLLIARLPFLQLLFQLLPMFLCLLLGLLGIIYFLHAHPDSASGPGDHARLSYTSSHREYNEPSLHARNHAVTFLIHGPLHPTLVPSVPWSFHWRLSS